MGRGALPAQMRLAVIYAHIGQSNARKPTTMGGPILSLKLLQALNDRDLKRVRECTKDK